MEEEEHFKVVLVPADEEKAPEEHRIQKTHKFYDEVAELLQIERIRWDYIPVNVGARNRKNFDMGHFVSDRFGAKNQKQINQRVNQVLFGQPIPEARNERIYGDAVLLISYYVDSDEELNRDGYQHFEDADLKYWESLFKLNGKETRYKLESVSETVFIKGFIKYYEPNFLSMKQSIDNLFELLPKYFKFDEWKAKDTPKALLMILCQKIKKLSAPIFEKEIAKLTHPPSFSLSVILPFPLYFDQQIIENNRLSYSDEIKEQISVNKNWKIIPSREYSTIKEAEHNISLLALYEIFRYFSHFAMNGITLRSLEIDTKNTSNTSTNDQLKKIKSISSSNFDCENNSNVTYNLQQNDFIGDGHKDESDHKEKIDNEIDDFSELTAKLSALSLSSVNKDEYETMLIADKEGLVKKYIIEKGTGDLPHLKALTTVLYVGKLSDGKEFDIAYKSTPLEFHVGNHEVIGGFDAGVLSMQKGEIAIIECSGIWAYGELGCPPRIPANATLFFYIHVLDIATPKAKELQNINATNETATESLTISDRIKRGTELKEEGNNYFKQSRYKKANKSYSKAIVLLFPTRSFYLGADPECLKEVHSLLAILLLNSAACYLQLNEFKKAKTACTKIICDEHKTDDLWPTVDRKYYEPGAELLNKVFFRRASAWLGLGYWKESLADLELCKLPPTQKKHFFDNVQRVKSAEEQKEKELYKRFFH